MTSNLSLQLGLEDLLADLHHARRHEDLGRLALVAYCDVRRWARQAGDEDLADQVSALITDSPPVSRSEFLGQIDQLISALEDAGRWRLSPWPEQAAPLQPEPGQRLRLGSGCA